jgi:hypothetical protein
MDWIDLSHDKEMVGGGGGCCDTVVKLWSSHNAGNVLIAENILAF